MTIDPSGADGGAPSDNMWQTALVRDGTRVRRIFRCAGCPLYEAPPDMAQPTFGALGVTIVCGAAERSRLLALAQWTEVDDAGNEAVYQDRRLALATARQDAVYALGARARPLARAEERQAQMDRDRLEVRAEERRQAAAEKCTRGGFFQKYVDGSYALYCSDCGLTLAEHEQPRPAALEPEEVYRARQEENGDAAMIRHRKEVLEAAVETPAPPKWTPAGPFRTEELDGVEQVLDAAGDPVCDAPGSLMPEEWEERRRWIMRLPELALPRKGGLESRVFSGLPSYRLYGHSDATEIVRLRVELEQMTGECTQAYKERNALQGALQRADQMERELAKGHEENSVLKKERDEALKLLQRQGGGDQGNIALRLGRERDDAVAEAAALRRCLQSGRSADYQAMLDAPDVGRRFLEEYQRTLRSYKGERDGAISSRDSLARQRDEQRARAEAAEALLKGALRALTLVDYREDAPGTYDHLRRLDAQMVASAREQIQRAAKAGYAP